MRKALLLLAFLMPLLASSAQESMVKVGTGLSYGKQFTLSAEPVDGDSIIVDYGDSTKVKQSTKTAWGTLSNVRGKLVGDTVRIYGALKSLEITGDSVTSLSFTAQKTLKRLRASNNALTYATTDLTGLDSLQTLDLNDNAIEMLNLMAFSQLETFSINNNPTLSTVVFADDNVLTSINMNNCDITHFYEKSMPKLNYLSIENGSLMDITIGNYYPSLNNLELSGNSDISDIDVSGCPELEVLRLSGTSVAQVNLVNNPQLRSLSVDHTPMTKLSLNENTLIQDLNVANTGIKKLDVSKLSRLRNVTIDSTAIARLDLTGKIYLSTVSAQNTNIEFLDMHDEIGYNGLRSLDLRNNKMMTPQTLNFTFAAMPPHNGDSWGTNVLISGIPGALTANTDLITEDEDNYYKVDVTGDGTASMEPVALTVENDDHGSVALTQIADNFSSWTAVGATVKPGYPISVAATPAEGYKFGGMMVDGRLVEDSIFVVSAAATVKPVFVAADEPSITLTVPKGANQQYFLGADADNTTVTVDWGDGQPVEYTIGTGKTSIAKDDGTLGTTVTIKGKVTYADFSSYEGFGTDNEISAIDITKNDSLRSLSTYMNEISNLDVSNEPNLESLDCAYSELENLDVTHNPKLRELVAYGNYLESLDLTQQKELVSVDLKGNYLDELTFGATDKMEKLILQGNSFSTIDVSGMPLLKELNVNGNDLETLDVTKNTELETLSAANNKLTTLDVSKNTKLTSLLVQNNRLTGLDLSNLYDLSLIYVGGNGWDACTLNDLYYSLNQWKEVETPYGTGNTLWVTENGASNENDAAHAESDIAEGKGWKVNTEGDGTGCDQAYITIAPTENGDVKLYDADNNEVKSGDKVKKNTTVTIVATPAEGYEVASAKANGKDITDNKFIVTKATDVVVKFTVATAIDAATTATVTVEGGRQEIIVSASNATKAAIYTLSGKKVFDATVVGRKAVSVQAGVYVVTVDGTTQKVLVK
ncbi:MAG: hypothetical protein SPM31_01035 [Prevotella sp.]|nr:hypothetical protein [Prevotella sp.]